MVYNRRMRLGQLLVESNFITQSELSTALSYAQAKALQIGRCMVLLRMVSDDHIRLALDVQKHIRNGLDAKVAPEILRKAYNGKTGVAQVLGGSENPVVRDYMAQLKQGAAEGGAFTTGGAPAIPAASAGIPANAAAAVAPPNAAVNAANAMASMPFSKTTTGGQPTFGGGVGADTPDALLKAGDEFAKQLDWFHAESAYANAVAKLEQSKSDDRDARLIRAMTKLLQAQNEQDWQGKALHTFNSVVEIGRRNLKAEDTSAAKAIADLADAMGIMGKFDLAVQCYMLAADMFEAKLPGSVVDAICNLRAASVISKDLPEQGERKRLGELFIASGLVNDQQLQQALAHGKQAGVPLGAALEQLKMITPQQQKSMVHCQMVIQQNILAEPVAIKALRLAWRQEMDLKTFLTGANIPPAKENSPQERELSECLDNLLGFESKGQGKSVEAGHALLKLGGLYVARDSIFDAEFAFRRAHNIFLTEMPKSVELVKAALGLANALIQQKRRVEAHAIMLKTMTMIPSQPSVELAEYFSCLSNLEYEQGATASAFSVARSAIAIMDQIGSKDAKLRCATIECLAKCADEMGDMGSYDMYMAQLDQLKQSIS